MVTAVSRQLIDGQWQDGSSGQVLVDRNPYDGSVIAEFPVATPEDIDAAYRAAARAKEEWDRVNPYAKRAVFENAVKYVESNFGSIMEIILDELGGTRLKAGFEIGLVLDMLKEAATFPLRMEGKILPSAVDELEKFPLPPSGRRRWRDQPVQLPVLPLDEVGRAVARRGKRRRSEAA